MKINLFVAVAAMLLTSCGGSSNAEKAVTDTVAEGNTEVLLDSAANDSVVVAVPDGEAVVVFDNTSEAKPEGRPLVIDFSATWCGPCQQFKPTYHKVAEEYASKATFATADVDECTTLAQKYQIQSIPYVLIINVDGSMAHNEGRMTEEEFKAFLDKNLK